MYKRGGFLINDGSKDRVEYDSVFTGVSPVHTQNRLNELMTLGMAGVFRLDGLFTLIYCTHKKAYITFRVMEYDDKETPIRGPRGNNHLNVEVVWKYGQI